MRFDAAILTLMCCFSFADPTSIFYELDTLVGCSVTKLSYKPTFGVYCVQNALFFDL